MYGKIRAKITKKESKALELMAELVNQLDMLDIY